MLLARPSLPIVNERTAFPGSILVSVVHWECRISCTKEPASGYFDLKTLRSHGSLLFANAISTNRTRLMASVARELFMFPDTVLSGVRSLFVVCRAQRLPRHELQQDLKFIERQVRIHCTTVNPFRMRGLATRARRGRSVEPCGATSQRTGVPRHTRCRCASGTSARSSSPSRLPSRVNPTSSSY